MFTGIDQEDLKMAGKKTGEVSFSVSLDLTKRRYNLLKLAQGIVKEMDNASFVCADVNCSLTYVLKMVLLNILIVSMSSVHY